MEYELIKYSVFISFTVTGRCIPFRTFLWIIFIILSISTCFSKNFYTNLLVLTRLANSCASWKYDLSGLWYVSDITPSWNSEFSSKSILISGSKSDKFLGTYGMGNSVGLRGGSVNWICVHRNFPTYILYGFSFVKGQLAAV